MTSKRRVVGRAALLAALALVLQGSMCHAHFCSGDCDDDEDEDDGTQNEMLVLPPLPFGLPVSGPIPLLLRIEPRAEHRER